MNVTTPAYCRDCGHLHDDWCDAGVIELDGRPAICGCSPTCDPCSGTGNGAASGWAGEHGACNHCGGSGKQLLQTEEKDGPDEH